MLWLGDSIAGAEAPALGAALKASGVAFKNAASSGGGNVVAGEHPVTKMGAKDTWQQLGKNLAEFKPDVVAYQITAYDWGTRQQQLAAYRKLAATVQKAGGDLVIVSAPPFKLDDFYKPYASAIRSAPETVRQAVQDGKAQFLDASELWGADASAPKAQRSKDGIHSCQQGSAAFATPSMLRAVLQDAPWAAAQAANWYYIAEQIGYWNAAGTRLFAHLWSIGVEWQFYLVWPLVVLAIGRGGAGGHRRVAAVAGAGALVSLFLMVRYGAAVDTTRAYEGTDTRAFSLLLGAVAATAPARDLAGRVPRAAADVLCAVLLGGLVLSWTLTAGEKALRREARDRQARESRAGMSATPGSRWVWRAAPSAVASRPPVSTPTTMPAPALEPASRSRTVSPAVSTRLTSRTPVASIARKIMYGAGRPAATSSTHTTASRNPSPQPIRASSASVTPRSKPVVRATLTPAARNVARASGTPSRGVGGRSAYAESRRSRKSAKTASTVLLSGAPPGSPVSSAVMASRLSAPIQRRMSAGVGWPPAARTASSRAM